MTDRARYRGALLGLLVGDVLGAPFEGHVGTVSEPVFAEVASASTPLRYTDDTAMAITLAESLLRCGGIDDDDLAQSFAHHWALAPERGYSSTTATLLARVHAGGAWIQPAAARGRTTNGAAMRVAPVALYAAAEPAATIALARRSARVTHPDPVAQAFACVQAAAVAAALRHPPSATVEPDTFLVEISAWADDPFVDHQLRLAGDVSVRGDPEEIAGKLGSGVLAAESVPAAICAFLSHPGSFPDAVTLAVRLGGDTDTTAAMTGSISGALLGERAIPAAWIARAEAANHVRSLSDALYRSVR
jgi:poly(ADP-ribose) glycohydrolase ARH3